MLEYLSSLENLSTLVLYGTPVTRADVEKLQRKLPQCEVFR